MCIKAKFLEISKLSAKKNESEEIIKNNGNCNIIIDRIITIHKETFTKTVKP